MGAALPQGTYALKDSTNEQSGYANTGFLFSFDAAWFPEDYLGIGATVTYGSNNPDKIKYREDLLNTFKNKYPNFVLPDDTAITFNMDVWKYLNLFVGPVVTIPAGRFNFDLRALAGISFVWPPDQTIEIRSPNNQNFSRNIQNKATPTLGFSAGGGIRYELKKGVALRVIAEYTNMKPELEFKELFLDSNGQGDIVTKKVDVPIKNIHLGIGLAYNFDL